MPFYLLRLIHYATSASSFPAHILIRIDGTVTYVAAQITRDLPNALGACYAVPNA